MSSPPTTLPVLGYVNINGVVFQAPADTYINLPIYLLISQYTDLEGNIIKIEYSPNQVHIFCVGLPLYGEQQIRYSPLNPNIPLLILDNNSTVAGGIMTTPPLGYIMVNAYQTPDGAPDIVQTARTKQDFETRAPVVKVKLYQGTLVRWYDPDDIISHRVVGAWNSTNTDIIPFIFTPTKPASIPVVIYVLPSDFDATIYKALNGDLQSLSDTDATSHYLNFGIKEGRTYKAPGKPVVQPPASLPTTTGGSNSNTFLMVGVVVLGAFLMTKK